MSIATIKEILGDRGEELLSHRATAIDKSSLHLPGPDFVDRVFAQTDRPISVLGNLQRMFNTGRLGGSGYLSILPVDQGIEHSGGSSFGPNPTMFDPESIVKLALDGGCNAVASTFGVLGMVARRYAHKIPFIVKINHNELLSHPNIHEQTLFGSVQQAFELGAIGIGATVYWGSEGSRRQLQEISDAFEQAHSLGMFTVLWCYVRNNAFKTKDGDHNSSADLTGQANHLGVTIGADIIKQKMPTHNGGYRDPALKGFGKTHDDVYDKLSTDHLIDLTRYQLANCYMGRCGLINSGGASGTNDLQDAVATAVINKRAGGMGLISGRKAFQKPFVDGVRLLNAIQDVYLCDDVTIA